MSISHVTVSHVTLSYALMLISHMTVCHVNHFQKNVSNTFLYENQTNKYGTLPLTFFCVSGWGGMRFKFSKKKH